jgi:hypothetical protein
MNALANISTLSIAALLSQVPDQVTEIRAWEADFLPEKAMGKRGRMARLQSIADRRMVPLKTVTKKFYAFDKQGVAGLIDRSKGGPAFWNSKNSVGLSEHDQQLVKTYVERCQRNSEKGLDTLLDDYRRGLVHTTTPVGLRGYPLGWSKRNLRRALPSQYELKSVRIGRSAAAEHRPLVYSTRANLWVGSHFLFDDLWHDHFVNVLDTRQTGRPLEFHALDLCSACKFAWGIRVRTERADGTNEGLKEAEMRFLLANIMSSQGYSPRGTTLVVERGTAAIREDLERILSDASGGLITVARGGMEGAAAHAGQYAGRSKGNYRFKAALESHGNLVHNEMQMLPGQTGKDRDHRPEQLHGLLKYNDALMVALSQLPVEQQEMLRWPLLTIQQFRVIAEAIYAKINGRTEHDLEGWDMRYLPDPRMGGMRKMSPSEVWRGGSRGLRPLDDESIAMILSADLGTERTTRNGMLEVKDSEISGDVLRFDATRLSDREKYLTVLNPFRPDDLFVFDSRNRFVAKCARIASVDRADVEAVQRACGRAAKQEAEMLAPLRARHLQEARNKAAMHAHNAEVLDQGRADDSVPPGLMRRQAKRIGSVEDFLESDQPVAPEMDTMDFMDAAEAAPKQETNISDFLP